MFINVFSSISNLKLHSLQVALITYKIAKYFNFDNNECILAGLFHDIGFLVPRYLKSSKKLLENEKNLELKHLLESDTLCENSIHPLIGSVLAEHLPVKMNIAKAIALHHKKITSFEDRESILTNIIRFSDIVSVLLLEQMSKNQILEVVKKRKNTDIEIKTIFEKEFSKDISWFILEDSDLLEQTLIELLDDYYLKFQQFDKFSKIFTFLVDHRSPFTRKHTESVEYVAESLMKEFRFSDEDLKKMRIAARFHDIGKVVTPLDILEKKGKLNYKEFWIMKKHIYFSYKFLTKEKYETTDWVKWAVEHHERLDGSGYPFGKKEKELSFPSKIFQVADVLVALSEDRPYRPGLKTKEALKIIETEVNKNKLDKDVFRKLTIMIKNGFDPIMKFGVSEEILSKLEKIGVISGEQIF